MRDLIEKALAASAPRTAAGRQLLETLRDLSGKRPLKREAVRAALGEREGRAISEASFAKRLERLNADLAAASARLRIVSEGGVLAARDEAASIEARLEERSRRETLREGLNKQLPRAMPEKLWVLFSYAWQPIKSQQAMQLDLFERLQHLLNQKPPEFQHLPQIEMWRDADRLERSYGADAQIKDICSRAFLVLAMMSGKYPTSQGCMDEFDAFVDDKGENRSGKMAIVVAVNCQRGEVARRFSDGLRLWVHDEGRTLVDSSRRSEASKHAFAKSVAVEIWKAAERYLGQTPRSETLTVDPIEQALERHGAKLKLADLVDPRAERGRTADEAAPKGDGANILDHLERWAINRDGARMTALLGDFGMGKTVTCQMLTQRLLAARKKNPDAPLPIYLDLREIKDARAAGAADLETLMRDMLAHVGEAPLDARAVIKYAREQDALIVFDGLDEVTNKLDKAQAEALYRALLRIVPEEDWAEDRAARLARLAPLSFPTKRSNPRPPSPRKGPLLLVSCRTHYFPDLAAQRAFLIDKDRAGLDATADVDVWFMLPFNEQQIKNCLTQTLGETDAARALELIETTYNLKETTSRPILLRFFSETFRELEERKLKGETIDIGKLYEAFVDQTFARDGIKHVIPPLQKKRLLAELALHLHVEGLNAIDNAKLDVWLAESIDADPALRKLKWAAEGDALSRFELFLQDLRSASLLVRPGETEFRFGHTSVREFFLAEALHRHAREGKLAALGSAAVTSETLDFLLARQRHAVTSAEAERWREGMRRLIEPGRGLDLRKFAYEVFRRARDIPWPSKADFSDLDLTGARFAAPGQGPRDALPLPPSAIWRGARLHQASFEGLRLAGQDFSGADTTSSFWVECDFSGAVTEGMDLSGAELRRCRGAEALAARMDLVLQVGGGDGRAAAPHSDVCIFARAPGNNLQIQSLQFDGRPCLAVKTARGQVQIVDAASGQMLGVMHSIDTNFVSMFSTTTAVQPRLGRAPTQICSSAMRSAGANSVVSKRRLRAFTRPLPLLWTAASNSRPVPKKVCNFGMCLPELVRHNLIGTSPTFNWSGARMTRTF